MRKTQSGLGGDVRGGPVSAGRATGAGVDTAP